MLSRVRFRERLRYWFDRTMAKGTPALIGWLGLASGTLILIVATASLVIAPGDSDTHGHWPGLLWRSLLRTLDPGTMGDDTGSAPFLALMLTSTVGGIFIVSALIGVLTTGLEGKLTELRKGRSRIVETGHTVVLGWSDQVFTIVSELVAANLSDRRTCVAILADSDKVDMDDEIRRRVGPLGRTRVVCRNGDPLKVLDLELVSPGTASSIVVLAPPVDDPDIYVIKVLLALGSREWEGERPRVVAAVQESTNLPAARLAGGPAAQVIDADDVAIRLVVQSHRQSGLSTVCTELLDFAGNEFYLHREPSLAGKTYGEALHAYELGTVGGLRLASGKVKVNPPADTVIGPDDEILILAWDDLYIRLADSRPPILEAAISGRTAREPVPDRTLLIGWNHRAPKIITLLDPFVQPGSALDIAADRDDPRRVLPQLENLTVGFRRCDPTNRTSLEELSVRSYRQVIVLSDEGYEPAEADARTLVTLLNLRDMEVEVAGDPAADGGYSIVSEINDDANREIAQVTRADDFIVSDKLISLMLTQLSQNPHLYDVFADLLNPADAEIYIKPADEYVQPGVTANFATVIEAARRRGESAIGYRLREGFHQPPAYGVVLNPDKAKPITLTGDDRVIVLAED